jgi:carbonic anhydrase
MHNHHAVLAKINNDELRLNRLCELNVIEQVLNVSRTTIVQNAWDRGQELAVHGWIYGIEDGLLRDLEMCITSQQKLMAAYEKAVRASG